MSEEERTQRQMEEEQIDVDAAKNQKMFQEFKTTKGIGMDGAAGDQGRLMVR